MALGEVVKPGRRNLKTWDLKSIFFHEDIDVTRARDYINSLVEDKGIKPVRFIVNRYNDDKSITFDTNTLVLIESIEWEDKAGEVGDLNFDMKLIEYRAFGGRKIK